MANVSYGITLSSTTSVLELRDGEELVNPFTIGRDQNVTFRYFAAKTATSGDLFIAATVISSIAGAHVRMFVYSAHTTNTYVGTQVDPHSVFVLIPAAEVVDGSYYITITGADSFGSRFTIVAGMNALMLTSGESTPAICRPNTYTYFSLPIVKAETVTFSLENYRRDNASLQIFVPTLSPTAAPR